jgi:hypothetical protein
MVAYRRRRRRRRLHRMRNQPAVPEMGEARGSPREIPELEGGVVERTTGRAELESSAVLGNDGESEKFSIAQG